MQRVVYFVFATSFAATAVSGLAMLLAPASWMALQKRLIAYIAPPQQADAFMRMFEAFPIRAIGAVYAVFGSVALYLLVSGTLASLFPLPIRCFFDRELRSTRPGRQTIY
jgi:hypothetical protein